MEGKGRGGGGGGGAMDEWDDVGVEFGGGGEGTSKLPQNP